jgi:uncharacterized protein (DUF983 family)
MAQEQDQKQQTLSIQLPRPMVRSLWRGFRKRCPACGQGRLFDGFLAIKAQCPACDEDLSHQKADDAPPYFTILLVGHIVIPLMWLGEKLIAPPIAAQIAFWLPLIAGMTLWFLPRVKGAIVGLQWAARMHGFGPSLVRQGDLHSHWTKGPSSHP